MILFKKRYLRMGISDAIIIVYPMPPCMKISAYQKVLQR